MLDITQHRTPEQWEKEAERMMDNALNVLHTKLEQKQSIILYGFCIKNEELARRGLIPTVNVITDMETPVITYPIYVYSLDFEGRISKPVDGDANSEKELMAIIRYYLPTHSKTCVVNELYTIYLSNL